MNTVNEGIDNVMQNAVEVVVKPEIVPVTPVCDNGLVKPKRIKKAKVAKEVTPVDVAPVAVETPVVAPVVEKAKIDVNAIVLPANVKLEVKKSFAKFTLETRKTVLKGSTLEFNAVVEDLDARLHVLSAEEIKKAHLGSMKAKLPGVKDTADLQVILDKYFA